MTEEAQADAAEFHCPNCGSDMFGTSCVGFEDAANQEAFWKENAKGHCNGYKSGQRCGFTWERKFDGFYFRPKVHRASNR